MRKNFTPFMIPIGGPLREPGRGRVLVAGDAGGFVNAFTAEGIYYAMVSGDLAAQAILTSTSDDLSSLARRYGRSCDYEIGMELRDSVRIQQYLFADPRRIARAIAGAHREQALTRLILEFVVGRRSYRNLRRRMLASSPLLACRVAWDRLTKKTLSGEPQLSTM